MERSTLAPQLRANLASLGWQGEDPELRDGWPAAERGGHLVMVAPPAPAWALPLLAGALARPEASTGLLVILAAEAMAAEWGAALATLTAGSPLRIEASGASRRAIRRLRGAEVDLLVASPEEALELVTRSALRPERIAALVFAWPEDWAADSAVAAFLQDQPKDQQRIVLTADPSRLEATDGLLERYVRRAGVITPGPLVPVADGKPIRSVATSWAGRAATLPQLISALDPAEPVVWMADFRDREAILHRLQGAGSVVVRSVPPAGPIICYDPPRPEQLAALVAVGDVVLLTPPGVETYLGRLAPERRPLATNGAATGQVREDESLRQELREMLDGGDCAGALYALAPLFESHDPQLVAAALLTRERRRQPVARPAVAAPGHGTAKIWVGAGKRDEATVGDLVAVLVREVGLARELIGRIELRDTFSLVEVPSESADRVVAGLTGLTIRRRKVVARVDRGPGGTPHGARLSGRPRRER